MDNNNIYINIYTMREHGYKQTMYTVLLQIEYIFSEEFEKSCKECHLPVLAFWTRNTVMGVLICGKKDPSLQYFVELKQ